jgi:putative RNA 2'-phosphotransferase
MRSRELKQLARFVEVALGRRPDELGLVPDREGFVRIKNFLQAVREEKSFRSLRQASLDELRVSLPHPPFEILGNRIRTVDRTHLPSPQPAENPPGLLFTGIRRKAWPHVHEKGLTAGSDDFVVLSSDRELATRMACRRDSRPVLLEVSTRRLIDTGILVMQFGASLFTAAEIPKGCFSGPPLPKAAPDTPQAAAKPSRPVTPGSFTLDEDTAARSASWQKGKRKKAKRKRERPPWRQ